MKVLLFVLSFFFVAFGNPTLLPWAGILASACGYGIFWKFYREISSRKNRFLISVLWYALVQAVQLSWMCQIKYQGIFIVFAFLSLIFLLGMQFGLTSLLLPIKRSLKWIDIVGIASFWVVMEWVRLICLCGLSLNFSGMALASFLPSMQLASVSGVLGLSFYVFLTNLFFLAFLEGKEKRKNLCTWVAVAVFPYMFGVVYINGLKHFSKDQKKELKVALVQTDLSPTQKNLFSHAREDFIYPLHQWNRIFRSLNNASLDRVDLIVMPEAAVPGGYDAPHYELLKAKQALIRAFGEEVQQHFPELQPPYATKVKRGFFVSNAFIVATLSSFFNAEIVVGLDYLDSHANESYNSAFHFIPKILSVNRYDKRVLVPIGEYLPFEWLRALVSKIGITDFFVPGKDALIFSGKVPFGVSICYEETFSSIMRESSNNEASLFVNLTNDAWFPNTILFQEHLDHARVRVVENGIALVRACNGGISAVVSPFGEVLSSLKTGDGTITHLVQVKTYPTLFKIWGNWFVLSFSMVFLILILLLNFLIFLDNKEIFNFNKTNVVN